MKRAKTIDREAQIKADYIALLGQMHPHKERNYTPFEVLQVLSEKYFLNSETIRKNYLRALYSAKGLKSEAKVAAYRQKLRRTKRRKRPVAGS